MLQYLGNDGTFIMYMNSLPSGFLLKNKRQDLKMNEWKLENIGLS